MEKIHLNTSFQRARLFIVLAIFLSIASPLLAQETAVLEWAERFGGSGNDGGRDFILDASGNVYTSGAFSGTVDFDPGPGVSTLTSTGANTGFVTKMDGNGNYIWAKTIAGTGSSGQGIAVDAAGNVYVVGGFWGTADFDPGPGVFNMTAATTTEHDIFIVKLDVNGNFVWAKGIIGGTWWDNPFRIVVDPTGNVVIVGRVYYQGGARDFDPGPGTYMLTIAHEDIFVLKLDTNGNFVWAKLMGGVEEDRGYSIAVDPAGNLYTTGYFEKTADFDPGPGTFNLTSSGDWDLFISKLDANGNFVWAKAMVNSSATYYSDGTYGTKIALDPSGNVYTTGRFSGTVDFDPGAGVSNLTAVAGNYDIFVSKLTTDGDFVWAKSMGGSAYDEGFSLYIDSSGDVYVAGFFAQTVDFDPGAGIVSMTSAGGNDVFALKLDTDGNFQWATSLGGSGADQTTGIVVNPAGEVYLSGWFTGTVDFDPGACTYSLVSAGLIDMFVQKLRQTAVLPPPAITSFTPNYGPIGASITIFGTNFSTVPSENVVSFFNNKTAAVVASTATSITVEVPVGAIAGPISVTVRCLSATSAQSFCVSSSTPSTTGLIAYYPFTGNANDLSGNNNNGTNNGATLTTDRFGNPNSAYQFNGTSSYISVPNSTSLTSPTTAITMSAWVNLAGLSLVGQNFGPIFTKTNNSANAFMYAFAVEPNGTAFGGGLNNWTNYSVAPFTFSLNQWYLVTVVFDNTLASFFINNTLIATQSFTVNIVNSTLPLEIGRDMPGLMEIFNGKIDDVRIYNRALTACEVSELYTAPNPGGPTITSFIPTSGSVGTTVTITGSNFSATPVNNEVTFNGTASIVTASTATSITTTVPTGATTGPITVTVSGNTAISVADFTVTVPTVIIVSTQPAPVVVCDGTSVTFTVSATGTTNITYQWQFASNSTPATFTDISNGGGYSNVATNVLSVNTSGPFGAGHYRCKISGDLAPTVFSNDATLTLTGSCSPVIVPQNLATMVGGSITLDLLPLISAPNGNLDINSISVTAPSSGATATITDGLLTIFYAGVSFSGTEQITITACDLDDNCSEQLFSIEVAGDIVVYNAVSPGGANPTLVIQFIESLPDTKNNRVTIFDRWQNQVWHGTNYDNNTVVFSGTGEKGSELPAGTYFYNIEFEGGRKAQTGFISLKR